MPLHIAAVITPPSLPYVQVQLPAFRVRFITATTTVTIPAVLSLTSQIGRSSTRFDGAATGQASLTADDTDRTLDARNTAGPLYGQLQPEGKTTVVLDVLIPSVGYIPLYTGLIENIKTTWPDANARAVAAVSLVDPQQDLMKLVPTAGKVFPQQQTGGRILALLGAPARSQWGWVNRAPSGLYAIDPGCEVMGLLTADGSTAVMDSIAATGAAEEGLFFFRQDGVPTFHSRSHRNNQAVPKWVLGDGPGEIPYEPMPELDLLNDRLTVDVALTTVDGVTSVYGPGGASAIQPGGTSTAPNTQTVPLADQYSGASFARSKWVRYSINRDVITSITINALADYPSMTPTSRCNMAVSAQIGDLITVNRRPGVGSIISEQYFIDAISHAADPGSGWFTTFMLVQADQANTGWKLGTDYLGALAPNPIRLNW